MAGVGGRLVRAAAALAVVLPIGAGVLLVGGPASAAVSAPGDGTVYTDNATVTITADYGSSSKRHSLVLAGPGIAPFEIASAPAGLEGGTMRHAIDTGCWTRQSGSCRPAPNGTWTVTQSGGEDDTSTFVTRVAPAAPQGVTATPISTREIAVSWRLGPEPDLTAWTVLEGPAVVEQVTRAACEGTTCRAVIGYASEGSGEHTYTVRAHRSVAPGSSETLQSAASAPASARLTTTPPPSTAPSSSPSPSSGTDGRAGDDAGTGTGGGGAGGSSGTDADASGPGGTGSEPGSTDGTPAPIGGSPAPEPDAQAVAQRKAFALSFSTFGPKLGIPKLPPLPQTQAPTIAPEDGTFEPTLGFEDKVVTERVEVAQSPRREVVGPVGSAIDSDRLATSTAGALVLLLAGAHLRRWLGSGASDH